MSGGQEIESVFDQEGEIIVKFLGGWNSTTKWNMFLAWGIVIYDNVNK
jgi:hypothetical protein